MNRIVREHYPVADLPDALRKGLQQNGYVRVTLEPEPVDRSIDDRRTLLQSLFAETRPSFEGLPDIESHIDSVRQEWD